MEISTDKQTETVVATDEKLSLKEKISYGFGDFGNGFMFDLGQLYLLKFFTDVAGIPAAAAGGIFLVSKLFAAVVDPIVGTSIDYRKRIGPKGKFMIAYPVVMGLMSMLGVLFFYICYRNCKERIIVKDQKYKEEKVTIKAISRTFFTNKPLLTLILMTVFTISAYNLKSAMLVYFAQYNLGNAELMASMNFIIIGSSFVGVLMLPKLVKMFGKKKTAILGLGVSVVADIINFTMPSNVFLFTILASIAFIGISIPNGVTWAFVSDAIDYGEWSTGERKEGTVYSLFNFSRKLAQSLSGFLSGIGLSIVGYVPNVAQKAGTLLGIKAILLLYPAVALSLAMLVLGYLYRLTDKKHAEMVADLNSRS